ncbi:MAG: membrane protein insertase YidC [Treponematales bacterium]
MSFADVLYTLVIWPLRAAIEFVFVFFSRTFYDPGLAIVLLSVLVNTALLPVYTVADRWQDEERALQKRMKRKLADIRAVFKGDERQMLINTYYRQMGYSPLSALKSSVGLLLQIPFFLAAYQFLSHTPSLKGESFLFLKDLAAPDGLLRIGTFAFNVMPVLMTATNALSALVYTRDLGARDKAQLFGMALLFLVLLYNSPSGLVLYWTCNNFFSLGKNLAARFLPSPAKALQVLTSLLGFLLFLGAVTKKFDVDRYTWLFAVLGLAVIAAPFAYKALIRLGTSLAAGREGRETGGWGALYFSSVVLTALLPGLLIPAQVIGSSVSDFANPWQFILRSFLQSASLLVMIPALIWAFSGKALRVLLASSAAFLSVLSLVCLFALNASYGLMTNSFKIEDPTLITSAFPLWVNPLAAFASLALVAASLAFRKQTLLATVLKLLCASALLLSFTNLVEMQKGIKELAAIKNENDTAGAESQKVFPLTITGNNTFIMFLDRAVGAAMGKALEVMPELVESFDGFTWYPNTLSFGHCTVTGLPAMLGGYDYTPSNIDRRKTELLKDKINEALTLLPRLAGANGYRVTVTDPTMANMQLVPDLSVYQGIENVRALNLDGRMEKRFLEEFPQKEEQLIDSFDFDILFRYGLFRIALPVLRYGIQYKGTWWRDGASNAYGHGVTEFSTLYYLSDFCFIDSGPDTLSIFMNETTHEPGAYTANLRPEPGVIHYSNEEIARFGSEDNTIYMYTFLAAINAAGRWLAWLREAGVYDNSRVIIVSDHGDDLDDAPGFVDSGMVAYNPLLMVKERGARGTLLVSEEFMTNADAVTFAVKGIENPVNPYLETPLDGSGKALPLTVSQAVSFQPRRHGPYAYNLTRERKFLGPDIFHVSSWKPWEAVK